MPTFARYLLIQLPGVLAVVAVLYRFLRRAYEVDPRSEMEKPAGGEAVVRRDLGRPGAKGRSADRPG